MGTLFPEVVLQHLLCTMKFVSQEGQEGVTINEACVGTQKEEYWWSLGPCTCQVDKMFIPSA